jgi:WD40 repeat protein
MSGRSTKRVQPHRASRQSPSFKLTASTSPGCYSVPISSETRVRRLCASPVCGADRYLIPRYLATCSADTTVKIWSVSPSFEFRLDKVLQGHQRWVWDCAFSADSAYLVTGVYPEHPRSSTTSGKFYQFSVLRSHSTSVGDGVWRDRPSIQWASQRYGSVLGRAFRILPD